MSDGAGEGCRLCPRQCGAKRTPEAGGGFCGMGTDPVIGRAALHRWEEPCISGTRGSGAVFFAGCTLLCRFCQIYELSRGRAGRRVSVRHLSEIFRRLEENDVCSYEDLMEAAASYKYNYSFLDGQTAGDPLRLEGFLFPDTYQFYVGMQASSAINKFLETFHYLLTADMLKQANDRGLNMRQVVTIASLIEKEAAVDLENGTDDRALISSVIYNRLKEGMTLGIDASILYVFPDHEGAPTAEMLAYDSPYNTRIYTGLPPTPICNPSLAAIKAALNPESTNYYFYALNTETGKHEFFTDADDFNEFVATQNYG